jgi:hypothetical protein
MSFDRNKIAQSLTDEELQAFIDALIALPGKERTLAAIKARAAELGISVSLESAKSFRSTTFQRYLARVERRAEKAQHIAQLAGDSTGARLGEASAAILAEKIFDELNTDDDAQGADEEPARLDLDKVELLSKSLARLRRGDVDREALQARLRESEGKVKEMEAKEKERAEKKAALQEQLTNAAAKKGGLTKETIEQIERSLELL